MEHLRRLLFLIEEVNIHEKKKNGVVVKTSGTLQDDPYIQPLPKVQELSFYCSTVIFMYKKWRLFSNLIPVLSRRGFESISL